MAKGYLKRAPGVMRRPPASRRANFPEYGAWIQLPDRCRIARSVAPAHTRRQFAARGQRQSHWRPRIRRPNSIRGWQAVRDGNGAEVLRRWLSTRCIEMFAQENYGGRRPSVRSVERRGVSPYVRDENRATAVGQASLQFGD